MEDQVLTDCQLFRFELVEDRNNSGAMVARGPFARAGVPTANGRVYGGKLWERELSRLQDKIKTNSLFGLLDHPRDGKTTLKEASHLITKLTFDGSNVIGEMRVLDTPNGKILKSIIESGAVVGVSSRGVGTTRKTQEGHDVVQDDYRLLSFDAVADPANATSWPKFATEAEDPEEKMGLTYEQLKEQHPELIQMAKKEALAESPPVEAKPDTTEMQSKLMSMVAEQRGVVEEQVRSELLSDPTVGGAKLALEGIVKLLRPYVLSSDQHSVLENKDEELTDMRGKLETAQAEIDRLNQVVSELVGVTEELSCRYYAERALGTLEEVETKERILSMLGDVSRFGSISEFKEALASTVEAVLTETTRQESENAEIAAMKEENEKLRNALSKSVQLGKALGVKAYLEQRLGAHPQAPAIREQAEHVRLAGKQDVDQLIEAFETANPLSDDFEQISSSLGGGLSHLTEGEEDPQEFEEGFTGAIHRPNGGAGQTPLTEEGYDLFGVSQRELRELSGLAGLAGAGDRKGPY